MRLVDCKQYSPEFWAARRGIPTASNAASILTPTGKLSEAMITYACQLVADLSNATYGQEEDYVSAAMTNGKKLEPEARMWYELEAEADVVECGFCLTDDGRWGCSPDAMVGDDGLIELKVPEAHTAVRYLVDGILPPKYRPQIHMQLVVTGRAWVDFMSYHPGIPSMKVRVVPDEYTIAMRDALENFSELYANLKDRLTTLGWEPVPMEVTETEKIELPACMVGLND
jgi:hypothetical protein